MPIILHRSIVMLICNGHEWKSLSYLVYLVHIGMYQRSPSLIPINSLNQVQTAGEVKERSGDLIALLVPGPDRPSLSSPTSGLAGARITRGLSSGRQTGVAVRVILCCRYLSELPQLHIPYTVQVQDGLTYLSTVYAHPMHRDCWTVRTFVRPWQVMPAHVILGRK